MSPIERVRRSWALLAIVLCGLWVLQAPLCGVAPRYRLVNLSTNTPKEVSSSGARAINGHGDIAGWYFVPGDDHAKPFVYTDGTGFIALDELNGFGEAINNSRQVAVAGYVPGTEGGSFAWRYTLGVGFESLGDLGVEGGAVPIGINNLGQVVGYSDSYFENRPWQDAFLYTDGIGMVNLGHLSNRYSTATAINDVGQITGHSGGYVFLFTEQTGMVAIAQGVGWAINNLGVVAGDVGGEAAIFENGTAPGSIRQRHNSQRHQRLQSGCW
jgi:probable HAF family extracellular repeat protein